MPTDYTEPFQITDRVGNNTFSYEHRGTAPTLWVPSLFIGSIEDVVPGDRVVFEDLDEFGVLQSCTGLAHLVKTTWRGIPTVVVDNHNHVFYFWCEALALGHIARGATLVHIDQHKDMRVPEHPYRGTALADAFDYTNFHLNVGNYIVPAQQSGLLGEAQLVTSGEALDDIRFSGRTNTILNIDLDFFAPEMSYIGFDRARRFIDAHLPQASLITVATSPFFIDQGLAIQALQKLVGSQPW